ncbi:unnamed protein product [Darwinula stevensoni]|uniref:Glycosyl hydrolase family 13 catalytic domain-containing protein n=1 Tax=Darwinula stevensoni TaxID=69355 RepID=A0A7R9AIW9_9CRUS|nr:unnamed protein product [Darwinula stevensoni]CAG0907685.1 unnamed protein product [Darwinula stevensoni]
MRGACGVGRGAGKIRAGGFSTSDDTWLPVNENYPFLNVELQREDPESHLNVYKILVALRSTNAHLYGELDFPNAVNTEDIFVFTRMYPVEGEDAYIIVVNFGEDRQVLNLNSIQNLGGSGVVLARSGHETEPGTEHGSTVDFNAVPIGSKVGLVISSPFLVET